MHKICRSMSTIYRLPCSGHLNLNSTTSISYVLGCETNKKSNSWTVINARQYTSDQAPPSGLIHRWDVVDEVVSKPDLTGPVIAFSDLNFIQQLFYPYTYTMMHSLDTLLNYMPWWLTIITATATMRLLLFPIYVKQTKLGVKHYNILPETQRIQDKMNEALVNGDNYEFAMTRVKYNLLMKEHGLSNLQRLLPTLIQAPFFFTSFLLLRRYSFEPLQSMATGGGFWFTNLLVHDPYFILPGIAAVSTLILFESGMEGSMTPSSQVGVFTKWFLRVLPAVIFAITFHYPASVTLFWSTNNVITLFYATLLKNQWIKTKLNIPQRKVHDPASLPLAAQSFRSQLNKALDKSSYAKSKEDLRRLDDVAFRKAGVGPMRKTYKDKPGNSPS